MGDSFNTVTTIRNHPRRDQTGEHYQQTNGHIKENIPMFDTDHSFRFSLVVNGLYRLMRFTSFFSADFRKTLAEKDMELTMTVPEGAPARTFVFHMGKIRLEKGRTPSSQVQLIWKTPEKGARIMAAMAKGDSKALMKAVMSGDLALEGDAAGIKWFLDLVTALSRKYRRKRRKKPPVEA